MAEITEDLQKEVNKLKAELEELTDALKAADRDALEWEERHDKLEEKLKKEIEILEREIWELENKINEQPNLDSMVDREKYDLFIDSIGFFSLEQFEAFLKTTKYIKI